MNKQCMDCEFYKKKEKSCFIDGANLAFNFACGGFCTAGYCKKQVRKNKTLKVKARR